MRSRDRAFAGAFAGLYTRPLVLGALQLLGFSDSQAIRCSWNKLSPKLIISSCSDKGESTAFDVDKTTAFSDTDCPSFSRLDPRLPGPPARLLSVLIIYIPPRMVGGLPEVAPPHSSGWWFRAFARRAGIPHNLPSSARGPSPPSDAPLRCRQFPSCVPCSWHKNPLQTPRPSRGELGGTQDVPRVSCVAYHPP